MKISLNWLKDFLQIHKTPEEIAHMLTSSGLEVEQIDKYESLKGSLEGIVIGEVITCDKHPDADKLRVTTVDIGTGDLKQIVCGAPNVAGGQKVVVATEGALLYPIEGEPFKIKKSKIRGVASEGMLCAEDEIGVGSSHAGIMVLDTELSNGTPASQYFDLQADIIFEIGLTPNRADAASHFGVARDLSAITGIPSNLPDISGFKEFSSENKVTIKIEDTDDCPRYAGILIENVSVRDSPEWLQNRLKSIGLTPINNVVDATNYVLHELGQPLHAFDADKITGNTLIVKRATEGDQFITLDGIKRKLYANNLMICDAEEPLVIAGVFGGIEAAVNDKTNRVFIESAYFKASSIRKTAQQHALKTDASFRYERGTDPEMVLQALKRVALILCEISDGTIASPITDLYPNPILPRQIDLSLTKLDRLIGEHIDRAVVEQILLNLDIKILVKNQEKWVLDVPHYRVDVSRDVDVAEEILRIYGYNTIPLKTAMKADYLAEFPKPNLEQLKERIYQSLSASGFRQIFTNPLSNSEYYTRTNLFSTDKLVNILNYNSLELNVMRQTMLFSGLDVIQYNINRRQRDLRLFELGTTYHQEGGEYKERQTLSLFLTGKVQAESWVSSSPTYAFQHLHAAMDRIFTMSGLAKKITSKPCDSETNGVFSKGLVYELNSKPIATAGQIKKGLLQDFELKDYVFYAEIDWAYISSKYDEKLVFEEIPRYPEVRRDLSLVLDKSVTFDQIRFLAWKEERKILRNINVFDVYTGEKVAEGKKAYSVSFILQDKAQTLTDKVIDATMNKLIRSLEKELGAVIRK